MNNTTKYTNTNNWDILREYYETHNVSLKVLSEKSIDIVGVKVQYDLIRKMASDQGWVKNIRRAESEDISVSAMVRKILEINFQSIVKSWEESGEFDPSSVNSFMSLLQKARVDLNITDLEEDSANRASGSFSFDDLITELEEKHGIN